ncbi:phosphotransferase family protein [Geodermatophilus sabuli]|uniref:Predicted kinase, aminoglycoside phosphotransferase (APT) family n=1 Tax=Geodermatophilus sabuli TaxID=1564158 RepID=A0A285E6J4_9ACTN|nr:phosphotransferase family protein [Geodermatophilus sabuli]MBB3082418.1 aminoglycoside phosphotransferase (APT) family kinase protein [Geodermatophilus sabuli]SNX94712.1 Predicted kinase, aminoglycoside phosphotransferase (APT) family [Geodermatophilus sabuli]
MTGLPGLDLDALHAHLAARGVDLAGPLRGELIAGGRSNLTFAVTDGSSRWVVRRPPLAGLTASAHDMAREHRVTSALQGTEVPVARPISLCEDDTVLGAPFTVVEWVDGVVVRDQDELAALSDDAVRRTTAGLVEVLVALHAVDVDAVGLRGFGRPEGFLTRQVALWRRQWDSVRTRESADLERLHALLVDRVPAAGEVAVVHGDYRIDNAILDRTDPGTVRAVVDWELSTLGDPLTDVALMCVYRHPALDVVLGIPAAWTSPRLPAPDALAEAYTRESDRDLGDWPFYLGLAHLKLAVIAAGIAHRAHAGADAGRDARRAAEAVPDLVADGLSALARR